MNHPALPLGIRTVMAYEVALLMFTHNFNRAAWVACPPQSIADFTSVKTRLTGLMFSHVLEVLMHQGEITWVMENNPQVGEPALSEAVERVCESILVLVPAMVTSMWRLWGDNAKTEITEEDMEKIASVY